MPLPGSVITTAAGAGQPVAATCLATQIVLSGVAQEAGLWLHLALLAVVPYT